MAAPDDFGLSPAQTLAFTSDVEASSWHRAFWATWQERVDLIRPRLNEWHGEVDPGDSTATHQIESVGHVRIGCRVVEPKARPVEAVLIAGHGYGVKDPLERVAHRWRSIAERGVAVVLVRARGFPGSQRDTGDLTGRTDPRRVPHGWVCYGLDAEVREARDAMAWVLPQAVADVVLSCRASRARYGARTPVYLHGESFSGGLAAIAAARLGRSDPIERFVLALPTFGDWPWRLDRRYGPESASGAQIARFMVDHARHEDAIREVLLLCDATVHARRVTTATLTKLAERDDVVPAPTAAAVVNGLSTEPEKLWRFVTPFGHHDGGLSDTRRHALFWRAMEDFLDPGMEPASAMRAWRDVMRSGERTPDGGDPLAEDPTGESDDEQPKPIGGDALFGSDASPDAWDAALVRAYEAGGRTLDDLPYTPEFEAIYQAIGGEGSNRMRDVVFRRLHNLRKAGRLPRLGRAATAPVKLQPDEEARLASIVASEVGSLGQRDRLPYTYGFERVSASLAGAIGRELAPHDLWRLICKIAK
ncbi:MAG: acetylxylan esterase [Planctomycetota bacterium]